MLTKAGVLTVRKTPYRAEGKRRPYVYELDHGFADIARLQEVYDAERQRRQERQRFAVLVKDYGDPPAVDDDPPGMQPVRPAGIYDHDAQTCACAACADYRQRFARYWSATHPDG